MFLTKKITSICFLLFAFCFNAFCQEQYTIFYYGNIAENAQVNQINISQDLVTAQIRTIPEMTLVDYRNSGLRENFLKLSDEEIKNLTDETIFNLIPENEKLQTTPKAVIFFIKIDKTEDETWICTYYAKNLETEKITSTQKNFETFYKILADAKNTIAELLSQAAQINLTQNQSQTRTPKENINDIAMTIEGVSGTWNGEKNITKIILMRSGRGFVIFSNGASMNIAVEIEKTQNDHKMLKITQQGNFNASFYPDIPRQKVLEYAENASPIQWTFMLTGSGTLSGFKNTLGLDDSDSIGPKTERVEWKKLN